MPAKRIAKESAMKNPFKFIIINSLKFNLGKGCLRFEHFHDLLAICFGPSLFGNVWNHLGLITGLVGSWLLDNTHTDRAPTGTGHCTNSTRRMDKTKIFIIFKQISTLFCAGMSKGQSKMANDRNSRTESQMFRMALPPARPLDSE